MIDKDDCENCGTTWRTWTWEPCDSGENCRQCQLLGAATRPGQHPKSHETVNEVVSWECPHGTDYSQLCTTCGHEVSGWGMGAAGYRDLCGCENQAR